ncbi:MAG: YitT family protein [Lachnotalea sp.]
MSDNKNFNQGNKVKKNLPMAYRLNETKNQLAQFGVILVGTFIFAAGINLFIVPAGLYNGGFVGIAQIIRTLIADHIPSNLGDIDLAGIINFAINMPLLLLAYLKFGKMFFKKTVFGIIFLTVFLTLIKSPSIPIVDDVLTACIVGGILVGFGTGIILRAGGSGGGLDILGMYVTKVKPGFSVGKLAMVVNFGVYLICALLFNIQVVIYSLIFTVFASIVMDRAHYQNINTSVMIFTKKAGLADAIIAEMVRGVTVWDGKGAYTNESTTVLVTVISKYEISKLKRIVASIDSNAFMIVNSKLDVYGNFEKRL